MRSSSESCKKKDIKKNQMELLKMKNGVSKIFLKIIKVKSRLGTAEEKKR